MGGESDCLLGTLSADLLTCESQRSLGSGVDTTLVHKTGSLFASDLSQVSHVYSQPAWFPMGNWRSRFATFVTIRKSWKSGAPKQFATPGCQALLC